MDFLSKYRLYLAPLAGALLVMLQALWQPLFHTAVPSWFLPTLAPLAAAYGITVYRVDLGMAGATWGWKSFATALVLAGSSVASFFGVVIPPGFWELTAAAGIGSLGHALNKVNGKAAPGGSGPLTGIVVMPLLIAACLCLGGCGTLFDPATGDTKAAKLAEYRDTLQKVESGVMLAEIGYDALCAAPRHPGFCDDPKAQAAYDAAKQLLAGTFATAHDALDGKDFDEDKIRSLLADAKRDLVYIETLIDALERGKPLPAAPGG